MGKSIEVEVPGNKHNTRFLRDRKTIAHLFRHGHNHSFNGLFFKILTRRQSEAHSPPNLGASPRLAGSIAVVISVSRQVRTKVARNRIKRVVRSHLYQILQNRQGDKMLLTLGIDGALVAVIADVRFSDLPFDLRQLRFREAFWQALRREAGTKQG